MIDSKRAVDSWLDELEGYSLRIERLAYDVGSADLDLVVRWLVVAFELGYELGSSNHEYESKP